MLMRKTIVALTVAIALSGTAAHALASPGSNRRKRWSSPTNLTHDPRQPNANQRHGRSRRQRSVSWTPSLGNASARGDVGCDCSAARLRRQVVGTQGGQSVQGAFRIELSERTEWLWAQASQDVMDGKPGAITAAVRVLDRWAKLTGSDAPTQIAVGHLDSMVAEMYASTDDRQLVLPSLPKLMPVQRER